MKVETKHVTPEIAKEILKRNINNRPLNSSHVRFLSSQMKRGLWLFDGTPIKLTVQGSLLDGQHRLTAIVESGKSFDFLFVTGVSSDSFKVMDTGRNRKASDVLGISGFDHSQDLQTACRDIMLYKRTGILAPAVRISLTNAEILQFAEENKQRLLESINFAFKFKKPIIAKAKLASFHFLFSEKNVVEAEFFISKMCTGLDVAANSPIYVLREKLIADAISKQKMTLRRKYAFIIKCWNMHRKGETTTTRLNIPSEDRISII